MFSSKNLNQNVLKIVKNKLFLKKLPNSAGDSDPGGKLPSNRKKTKK